MLTRGQTKKKIICLVGPVPFDKALHEIIPWTRLLDGDGEGPLSRDFRSLDDLLGEVPPTPADTGAGDDALARRPGGLGSLDSDQNLSE